MGEIRHWKDPGKRVGTGEFPTVVSAVYPERVGALGWHQRLRLPESQQELSPTNLCMQGEKPRCVEKSSDHTCSFGVDVGMSIAP